MAPALSQVRLVQSIWVLFCDSSAPAAAGHHCSLIIVALFLSKMAALKVSSIFHSKRLLPPCQGSRGALSASIHPKKGPALRGSALKMLPRDTRDPEVSR